MPRLAEKWPEVWGWAPGLVADCLSPQALGLGPASCSLLLPGAPASILAHPKEVAPVGTGAALQPLQR